MFPWVTKSSFLCVALLSFSLFILTTAFLLGFTTIEDVEVLQFEREGSDCHRLTDVSGSLPNAWPLQQTVFANVPAQTPLEIDNSRTNLIWWFEETSEFRRLIMNSWVAEIEGDEDISSCSSDCRFSHAVDHPGAEFFIHATSASSPQVEHPEIILRMYNFPGQLTPLYSFQFYYDESHVFRGTTTAADGSQTYFSVLQYFHMNIVMSLKFGSDSLEVWVQTPSDMQPDNTQYAVEMRAFLINDFQFTGPYWLVLDTLTGTAENIAFWSISGSADPPALQDFLYVGESAFTFHSVYQTSQESCEAVAGDVCSDISANLGIEATSGRYGESMCYSESGQYVYRFEDSLGTLTYSWKDIVWQGRSLGAPAGWEELRVSLIPRAIEMTYAQLVENFSPKDWYICGYKQVPEWSDCLSDSRCIWDDNGVNKTVGLHYTASSAISRFGSVPCIEAITDTQVFIKDTLADGSPDNCMVPKTLDGLATFLEIPGPMNSWWGCDSSAQSDVQQCVDALVNPSRIEDPESCVTRVQEFPKTYSECLDSDLECFVVTKFDGTLGLSDYLAQYQISPLTNITGNSLFNFTHLYISPFDQCQHVEKLLCGETFTQSICGMFGNSGPYLCKSDVAPDMHDALLRAGGAAALVGWLALMIILLSEHIMPICCCCCPGVQRQEELLEKKKVVAERKRARRKKRRDKREARNKDFVETSPVYVKLEETEVKRDDQIQIVVTPAPGLQIQQQNAQAIIEPPLKISRLESHDIPVEFWDDNDPKQVQEMHELAHGTLPLLYSDYSDKRDNMSPDYSTPLPNRGQYINHPDNYADLAYDDFGDNDISGYNAYRHVYSSDVDSLPEENFQVGQPHMTTLPMISSLPDYRGSPLESRFMSSDKSTITTTGSDSDVVFSDKSGSPPPEIPFNRLPAKQKVNIEVTNVDQEADVSSLSEFEEPASSAHLQRIQADKYSWSERKSSEPEVSKDNLQHAIRYFDQSSESLRMRSFDLRTPYEARNRRRHSEQPEYFDEFNEDPLPRRRHSSFEVKREDPMQRQMSPHPNQLRSFDAVRPHKRSITEPNIPDRIPPQTLDPRRSLTDRTEANTSSFKTSSALPSTPNEIFDHDDASSSRSNRTTPKRSANTPKLSKIQNALLQDQKNNPEKKSQMFWDQNQQHGQKNSLEDSTWWARFQDTIGAE